MNTRIILLTICISFYILGSASAQGPIFPTCSPEIATQSYEDTLFMFFIHRGHEDNIRAHIWYILKLVSCYIEVSPDFRALIVDFSKERTHTEGAFNIENLPTTLAKTGELQSDEPLECSNFQSALANLFQSPSGFGKKNYKHIEVIIPNLSDSVPHCNLLTMFNEYRGNHTQDFEKVHPMIIPMSNPPNGICLDIQNHCVNVNVDEEPQIEVDEYFKDLSRSFYRPKINNSTTVATFDPSTEQTSPTQSAGTSSTVPPTPSTAPTTVPLIEESTVNPIPRTYDSSKPAKSKPDPYSDHPVQFWLSIFLVLLLLIAIILTSWIIFRVWKLKQRLKKMDEWRIASREKMEKNKKKKESAEMARSKTKSGSKEKSKSQKSKSRSQKAPSDKKKKRKTRTRTTSKSATKTTSKSPAQSRENVV